jgi:CubicO group peptidase (beta-lactamase class C family)
MARKECVMRRTECKEMLTCCLALAASLACTPAAAPGPVANARGAASAEPVRVITERTDQLRLAPEEQLSPDVGAEAALRRHIESVQRGAPNYDDMAPPMADNMRSQPDPLETIAGLGEIRSIVFKGKGPQGGNIFNVETTKGVSEWRILLNAEGKIAVLLFRLGPPTTVPSEPELLRALEARLDQATAADSFSGVVLLAKGGKPIFQAARGLADRERKQKVGMQTKFRIGSMNKMFTAVAVLQLRERGKLSLDDTLAKWLPDYPNAELAKSVTLHHLLTHTGGTGDIFGPLFGEHRQELTSHQAYIDLYGQRGLEFTPGARFAYSNYGFVLLGRVIEKASGESYYDYVREHVYAPAKMIATGSEPESESVTDLSVGYRRGPDGLKPNVDTLPPRGTSAGGGYSTAEDLLRFADALQSHTLLSEESTQLLMMGKIPTDPRTMYAYGFSERNYSGIHTFGHGGGAPGMNGELAILPGSRHVVVALANMDPPAAGDLVNFIIERLPREQSSPESAPSPASARREPPRGPNLVDNGDFSHGDALWTTTLWPPVGPWQTIPSRVENGALCASIKGGQSTILSWQALPGATKAIELREGQPYRLSLRASMTGPLAVRLVAKVGHQELPFTPAVQAPIPVEGAPHVFAIDFEPDHADAKAGIAFILSAPSGEAQNEVCIDDVALVGSAP